MPVERGWHTWATTIATAFAYFVGYASVSIFASTLSVSPIDIGLDLRDYLLLTGLTALTWVPVLVATALLVWLTEEGERKKEVEDERKERKKEVEDERKNRPKWLIALAFAGCFVAGVGMVLAGWVTSGGNIAVGIGVPLVLLLGITVLGAKLDPKAKQARRRWMGLAAVVSIVVATPLSISIGSYSWAKRLMDDAKKGNEPSQDLLDTPFPLRLVLQPELGSAIIETDGATQVACVLRIGERVFLGSVTVVVRDVTSFTSSTPWASPKCNEPDAVPWVTPHRGSPSPEDTDGDMTITPDDIDPWPFETDEGSLAAKGTLACEDGAVTFETDGTIYLLNGPEGLQADLEGWQDLHQSEYWNAIGGDKVDLGPVIDFGLRLCEVADQ